MMLIISITYILFVTTAGKKWGKGGGGANYILFSCIYVSCSFLDCLNFAIHDYCLVTICTFVAEGCRFLSYTIFTIRSRDTLMTNLFFVGLFVYLFTLSDYGI
jgi:hypothetical protein